MKYLIYILIIVSSRSYSSPLNVVTSIPSIKSIVEKLGGPYVNVKSISKAKENPHFISIKPSFVKLFHRADLLILSGLDLESAWAPVLIKKSKNNKISIGSQGYLDLSKWVKPLQVVNGVITRKMGDLHGKGNPHYMVSPLRVLKLISHISEKLVKLLPEYKKELIQLEYDYSLKLASKIFGSQLLEKYKLSNLLKLMELKKLHKFLEINNQLFLLGGWIKSLIYFKDKSFYEDHSSYSYFLNDFLMNRSGSLEPKPGVRPSFKGLRNTLILMRKSKTIGILSSPFFPKKFLNFIENKSEAKIIYMSHQLGSKSEATNYIDWIDFNVHQLIEVLGE
ncbi:MAG: hypothetical protein COB02_08235 [Candidatus Cloacimonadota bacterium]|nr:MAG: hypothetical protein COB02_08235 [Candidatus Cloacimonadota bacterium]